MDWRTKIVSLLDSACCAMHWLTHSYLWLKLPWPRGSRISQHCPLADVAFLLSERWKDK